MAKWLPLMPATIIINPEREAAVFADALRIARAQGLTCDEEHLRTVLAEERALPLWKNLDYQVAVRTSPTTMERGDDRPGVVNAVHLSIKRIDQKPVRDWRDLQRIKNQLLGEECEAVELFPAESRLVDNANQFHLWGYDDPTFRFPLGFGDRMVSDDVDPASGVVQRRL